VTYLELRGLSTLLVGALVTARRGEGERGDPFVVTIPAGVHKTTP